MTIVTLVGLVAATLTTIAAFPQAFKSWKTKKTHDISLQMYVLLTSGVALWFVYGILISDWPLIIANLLGGLLISSVLVLKLRYG